MIIPKRPKEKASVYRSRNFKQKILAKISKWSPRRVFATFFTKFDTSFNPYALDWFETIERSRTMQARAEAMFDAWQSMLRVHVDNIKTNFSKEHKAGIKKALTQWCEKQTRIDGRPYRVIGDSILPDLPSLPQSEARGDAIEQARLQLVISLSKKN